MSDYISREAAEQAKCEFLNEYVDCQEKSAYAKGWNNCNSAYRNSILELPAADVKPVVRGEWIEYPDGYAKCSNCNCDTHRRDIEGFPIGTDRDFPNRPKFCPHCGADMRGVKND